MSSELFSKWLQAATAAKSDIAYFVEKKDGQQAGLQLLKPLLADHFVGESAVLKLGGYDKVSQTLKNSLPTYKRTQSGDLGELLATEYVNAETSFTVPIKKLRWKSDRQMPMHGNDVLGIDVSSHPHKLLKCECKSRGTFTLSAVTEASEGLDGFDGRPNPSTLAFITKRLLDEDRLAEAQVWSDLQTSDPMPVANIVQMVFAFGGNDPTPALAKCPKAKVKGIKRKHAAVRVASYSQLIEEVYKVHDDKP